MKYKTWSTLLTFALVVSLTGTAFAGNGSGTFTLISDATVEGKELHPGEYSASWSKDGEIWLTGENGARFKVQGQVVERAEKASRTSIVKQNDASGASRVVEVRFAGKRTVLVFGESKVAQKK